MASRYCPSTDTESHPNPSLRPFSDPSFEPQIASLPTVSEQVVLRSAGQSGMRPYLSETPDQRMWVNRTAVECVKTVSHASLQRSASYLALQYDPADQSVPMSRLIQGGTYSTSDELGVESCNWKGDTSAMARPWFPSEHQRAWRATLYPLPPLLAGTYRLINDKIPLKWL